MDEKLLDKIIPLSDEETEMEEIRDELEEEGEGVKILVSMESKSL